MENQKNDFKVTSNKQAVVNIHVKYPLLNRACQCV